MKTEVEKEIKIQLSQADFLQLINYFNADQAEPLDLMNVYFEHPQFQKNGLALRIRLIQSFFKGERHRSAELTLKETISTLQKNEYNLSLRWEEALDIISNQTLHVPVEISQVLKTHQIDEVIFPIMLNIHTKRYEIQHRGGLLVLDEVTFDDQSVDYELEYEVNHLKQGQLILRELLNQLDIPYKSSQNKLARAFNKLK